MPYLALSRASAFCNFCPVRLVLQATTAWIQQPVSHPQAPTSSPHHSCPSCTFLHLLLRNLISSTTLELAAHVPASDTPPLPIQSKRTIPISTPPLADRCLTSHNSLLLPATAVTYTNPFGQLPPHPPTRHPLSLHRPGQRHRSEKVPHISPSNTVSLLWHFLNPRIPRRRLGKHAKNSPFFSFLSFLFLFFS